MLRTLSIWELYTAVDCWIALNRVVTSKDTVLLICLNQRSGVKGIPQQFRKQRPLLVFVITKTKPPLKSIRNTYMKSNCDRSKTISRKTIKNYHPHADDPRLLKICRHVIIEALKRGRKTIDHLCIIGRWKYALRRQLVYNFGLSLKIVKLAFHVLEMDFCLRVSATVIALPKNHPFVCLFILFFLKLKSKIFEMIPC